MAAPVKFRCSGCSLTFSHIHFAEGHERVSKHEVSEVDPPQRITQAPAPEPAAARTKRDDLRDELAKILADTYVCSRVWEAWEVGTMSSQDFSPASEDEEIVDSLIDAVLAAEL